MRAFITGIDGFVGKHLSEFLLSKGFDVYGVDLSDNSENDKVVYSKADILDANSIKKMINNAKPDFIFHLAGFSSVKKSFENPELCKKINVDGTKNLFDAILDSKIDPKILVVSSADVYGIPTSIPIKENDEIKPISPYGESRAQQEELCKEYHKKHNLKIIISRSFPHIGIGQDPMFVVSNFAKQIAEIEKIAAKIEKIETKKPTNQPTKKPTIKVGNLEAKRDFTDVKDVVEAYLLALEKAEPGETYNICSGKSSSIKEILDKLLSYSKTSIKIEQDQERLRTDDIPILEGDNSKFRNKTGWSQRIPIEQTLKDVLDWFRKN